MPTASGVATAPAINRERAQAKFNHACFELITTQPFFATLFMGLERVEDPTQPTMWTDGTRLGYNLRFVQSLTNKEVLGVLVHEVMHVACLHMYRRGGRDPRRWNIACDHVVNGLVLEAGFSLPADGLPPMRGHSAEAIYDGLPKNTPAPRNGMKDDLREPSDASGRPLSDTGAAEAVADAQVRIRQARTVAENAGPLPAWLARVVNAATEPLIPWPAILAQFLDQWAQNDYSFTHPNVRYGGSGVVLPGRHSLAYGEVVLACDTSGSITNEQLGAVVAEVQGCLAAYADNGQEVPVTVLWFDHAVTEQTIDSVDPKSRPVGGGGTSYRVVMEWMAAREELPRALLILTDGECADFGDAPAVPVLWFLSRHDVDFRPPYGVVAGLIADPPPAGA